MALRHVRCIGMSDEEMELATQLLSHRPSFERTGFNVIGLADDEDVRKLEEKGLIVEQLPEEPSLWWAEPSKVPPLPESMTAETAATESPLSELAEGCAEWYIIQFKAHLTDTDRKTLADLGVKLGRYVPDFAYKAQLTPEQKEAVESLTFVNRVIWFDPTLTLRGTLMMDPAAKQRGETASPVQPRGAPAPEQAMYHVRCHNPDDIPAVYESLSKDPRIQRVEKGQNRIRIWTQAGTQAELLKELASLPQVSGVEPYEFPSTLTLFVRQALGVELPGATPLPWRGEDQLVGVADTGVDIQHPDLKSRVKQLIERVPPEAPNDPDGHGTHVCSIIAGDGTASDGALQGVAPGAKLVVQSVRDRNGTLSGFPVDLGDLFQQAYDEGARIHNNSWGYRSSSLWTTDAYELDKFVFDHPDFLIVVAAGNEGQQPNPLEPDDTFGRIDYSSITSPGTSKNAITVGACCSSRADGPYQGKSWRDYHGLRPSPQFPLVAEEPISGNPKILAAFSSRGPTDDVRVKPDLVVPGTVILAAKSGPSNPSDMERQFSGHYAYKSGTSMAAPALAGAAAIARQYYIQEKGHERPSAALLKATLVNGAEWIDTSTAQDELVGEPNYHQGFGRLNLRLTLPIPGNPEGFSLRFVDIYNEEPRALNKAEPSKTAWKRRIQVKAGMALRITLCWTDRPQHGLQNHLDLMAQSPTNARLIGNLNLQRGPWAKTDRFNNVERIIVEEPAEGVWTVMVNAANTPFPPQGFSLVITGNEVSDFF